MEANKDEGEMRMTQTVQKWGNSLGIRIPKKIAEKYGLVNGSEVEILASKEGIFLKPAERIPTLEELMSKITEENQHDEIDWGEPRGAEI